MYIMAKRKKGAVCKLISSKNVVKCDMKNGDTLFFVPKRKRRRKK